MCSCVYTQLFKKKFTLSLIICLLFDLYRLLLPAALRARGCFPDFSDVVQKKFPPSFLLLYPLDTSARLPLLLFLHSPSSLFSWNGSRTVTGVCGASHRVAHQWFAVASCTCCSAYSMRQGCVRNATASS